MTNMMHWADHLNRRVFLKSSASGIGTAALASLLTPGQREPSPRSGFIMPLRRSGSSICPVGGSVADGPVRPQAAMAGKRGEDLPDSIRKGQRLTTMTSGQAKFPVAPSIFQVRTAWRERDVLSDIMPHMARSPTSSALSARCIPRRSTTTGDYVLQNRFPAAGRPSIGSWASYGLAARTRTAGVCGADLVRFGAAG